jgi:hypothetical protein
LKGLPQSALGEDVTLLMLGKCGAEGRTPAIDAGSAVSAMKSTTG